MESGNFHTISIYTTVNELEDICPRYGSEACYWITKLFSFLSFIDFFVLYSGGAGPQGS